MMGRRHILTCVGGFLAALLVAIACRVVIPTPTESRSSSLLIAAAASLKEALEELDPLFEKTHPAITVNYNFAASGPLQQQIEQGAPVDLFISAASKQMDALQQKNLLVANSRRNLLTNRLVLVVPTNSSANLTNFWQLVNPTIKKISLGEPRSVPAGQYAEEVFKNLGIFNQIRPKFVYGNSVRNVLATVESGNADAGIVYQTDAKISKKVKTVATAPQNAHAPIVYPMAVIRASRHQSAAQSYAEFLTSPQAQRVFRRYEFGISS